MSEHTLPAGADSMPSSAGLPTSPPPRRRWSRKRSIVVGALAGGAAAAVVGGIVGTAGDDAPAEQAAPTTTTFPPAPAAAAPATGFTGSALSADNLDDLFVGYIDSKGIYFSSRSSLIDLGHTVCSAFDTGVTFQQMAVGLLAADTNYAPGEIGTLIGASVGAYCPEHADQLDGAEAGA